jgi:hypothetical protein
VVNTAPVEFPMAARCAAGACAHLTPPVREPTLPHTTPAGPASRPMAASCAADAYARLTADHPAGPASPAPCNVASSLSSTERERTAPSSPSVWLPASSTTTWAPTRSWAATWSSAATLAGERVAGGGCR